MLHGEYNLSKLSVEVVNLNLIMVFLISANYSWIGTTRAIYLSIQSCWAADPMCLVSGNFRWIINCKWNNKRPQKNSEFLSSSFPGILASWKNLSTKLRIFELYQFSTRTINISELCTEIHILYWDLWHHIIFNFWNSIENSTLLAKSGFPLLRSI